MDTRLAQKELWQQFFKHCQQSRDDRTIRFQLVGDALIANGQIVGDIGTESIEMGMARMIKSALEEKVAEYEQKQVKLKQEERILRVELMRASDTLASQGLSVDRDYGSDADDVKGG